MAKWGQSKGHSFIMCKIETDRQTQLDPLWVLKGRPLLKTNYKWPTVPEAVHLGSSETEKECCVTAIKMLL